MTIHLDWTAVAALATSASAALALISVWVALTGIWQQNRAARIATGVQMLWQLEHTFKSREFLQTRMKAARALTALPTIEPAGFKSLDGINEIADVLSFFESVGLLTQKGVLDEQFVYSAFSAWVIPYWLVSARVAQLQRESDPSAWCDAEALFSRLLGKQAKMQKRTVKQQLAYEQSRCAEFLQSEIATGQKVSE